MKKRYMLFGGVLLLAGISQLAEAEVVTGYTESFENLDVTKKDFRPFGWLHHLESSYSYGTYRYYNEGGYSGGYYECELSKNWFGSMPYYLDILITPPVTGTSSVWVKANGSDAMFEIYAVGDKTGTNTYEVTKMEISLPELVKGEWVKVEIPAVESQRLGILAHQAGIDEFKAESADVQAYMELALTESKLISDWKVAGDAEGRFDVTYSLTMENLSDVTLNPGDDGYCLSHYIYQSASTPYIEDSVGEYPIGEPLAPGEKKTMEITVTLAVPQVPFTAYDLYVCEGITGSRTCPSALTYVPYIPEFGMESVESGKLYTSCLKTYNAPYVPLLHFGSVYTPEMRKKTVKVKNIAPKAPMTLLSAKADGDFEAVFDGPVTIASGEAAEVQVIFKGEAMGVTTGELKFVTEELGEQLCYLSAAVDNPEVWHEGFENQKLPAGFFAENTYFYFKKLGAPYEREGHEYTLSFENGTGRISTGLMHVDDGQSLVVIGNSYAYGSGPELRISYSADRNEWFEILNTSSQSNPATNVFSKDETTDGNYTMCAVTTSAIPAGDWYLRIEASCLNIDEIFGYQAVDLDYELYIREALIAPKGRVNAPLTATARVVNLGKDIESGVYSGKLYVGDEVVAQTDGIAFAGGDEVVFEFSGNTHHAGVFDAYIEFTVDSKSYITQPVEVVISEESAEETMLIGPESGSCSSAPVNIYNSGTLCEMILTEERLQKYQPALKAGDKISSLSFYGSYSGVDPMPVHASVYVRNTEIKALEGGYYAEISDSTAVGFCHVYEGITTVDPADNGLLFTIDFDEPQVYTGNGLDVLMTVFNEYSYKSLSFWSESNYGDVRVATAAWKTYDSAFGSASSVYYDITVGLGLVHEIAVVRGKVTDSADETAIEGVEVRVASDDDVYYTALTDADGCFSIEVLQSEKEYRLSASHADYLPYIGEEYLDFNEPEAEHNIILVNNKTSVFDIVGYPALRIYSDGHALVLSSDEAVDVVITDAAGRILFAKDGFCGRYELGLDKGVYIVNRTKVMLR